MSTTNPRRAELRALSMAIRPLVKAGRYESVNAGLLEHYREETGQSEFHTFQDWRKANGVLPGKLNSEPPK